MEIFRSYPSYIRSSLFELILKCRQFISGFLSNFDCDKEPDVHIREFVSIEFFEKRSADPLWSACAGDKPPALHILFCVDFLLVQSSSIEPKCFGSGYKP